MNFGKMAFLFSGQGAQCTGMMKDIYDNNSKAREIFETADKILGRGISELCFSGDQEDLNLTHNTQPCMIAAELAAYAALVDNDIFPDAVAGFSLGEYAALVAAGAISVDDVFRIIQIRADSMQEAAPLGSGGMAAVMKVDAESVEKLCEEVSGYVIPVNYNCPGQIVVSGEMNAIDEFVAIARERKIRAVKLSVSGPFHCELMNPAAEKLREAFASISFGDLKLPCYSNVDAKPYDGVQTMGEQLCKQVKSPVQWEQTLRNMYENGIRTFVEVGPGSTLASFVKKTFSDVEDIHIFSINSQEALEDFLNR